jgi:hypothetical protein
MLSNKILALAVIAGFAAAPFSTASAAWHRHDGHSRSGHGRGPGGLIGAVVGIATLPLAILASAASSAPRPRATGARGPSPDYEGDYGPQSYGPPQAYAPRPQYYGPPAGYAPPSPYYPQYAPAYPRYYAPPPPRGYYGY